MLIKGIKSVSDVITNSSSEVFVIKISDNFQEYLKNNTHLYPTIINNEETLKEVIMNDDIVEDLDSLVDKGILKCNPLGVVNKYWLKNECNKTFDEIWEFFKDSYLPLIGYCYISNETDNSSFMKKYGHEIDGLVNYTHLKEGA